MTLSKIADITAIVSDILIILLSLGTLIVILVIYSKISAVFKSVKRTATNTENVVDTLSSMISDSTSAGSGIAYGLSKVFSFFSGQKSKKPGVGESDGQ